jgi:hypothetical protein
MDENLGRLNKPQPVTCDRVVSEWALMGLRFKDAGWKALYLIKREDIEAWKEVYDGYQEVPFDDYSEFFPWTQNK